MTHVNFSSNKFNLPKVLLNNFTNKVFQHQNKQFNGHLKQVQSSKSSQNKSNLPLVTPNFQQVQFSKNSQKQSILPIVTLSSESK